MCCKPNIHHIKSCLPRRIYRHLLAGLFICTGMFNIFASCELDCEAEFVLLFDADSVTLVEACTPVTQIPDFVNAS